MSEQNKAMVRRYLEEVFADGNLDAIPELFAADYVERDPASAAEIRGHAGVRQDLSVYQTAFSDIQITVEDQIAEGDCVATRATLSGTHVEELSGIPPTGNRVTVTGIVIHRMTDGRLVEGWWNWDTFGLLAQLGAIPAEQPA
jgi:steroid delta-isomerase-like uncharacterized protein